MKSNLTEQINRMSFLMGLDPKINENSIIESKKILKESSSVFSWAKAGIGRLLQTAEPIRGTPNYKVAGFTLDSNLHRTLKRLIDPSIDESGIEAILSQLSKSDKIALGNIFSQSDDIVTDVYDGIMRDLMSSIDGFDEYRFYQMIKEQTDSGIDLDTVIKGVFGDDELIIAILRSKVKENLKLFEGKKFVPKYRSIDSSVGAKQLGGDLTKK